ncbi:MAG: ATP-binding protein [Calditrichia bacterium]|nr:ATP-binding protein [Calditrichia bacterium]
MKSLNYAKQKKIIYWIISLGIVFLLIANTIAWIYLQRIKSYFDSDLKFRMENVIQISSKLIDAAYLTLIVPGDENDPQVIYYQQLLFDIKEKNNLQDIYIISPVQDLLIDVNPDFIIGNNIKTIEHDLIKTALSGRIISSDIYTLGEHKFLTAAVPLIDETNSVTGILVAEARAEFFNVIEEFNNGLVLFSMINALVILTVAFFLYRSLKNLIVLQNKVKNQEHLVKLGEMAAAVAHEIRNPLSIIRGTNELISKKYGKSDDEFFKYIPLELDRLNKLINDFLSFARSKELKYEKVDIRFLLDKIIIGFKDNPDIKINIKIDDNVKIINADPDALEQILLNIMNNSIQSLNNHGQIVIKVDSIRKKEIRIIVEDNGTGIEPESLKKVFEPFFSTREKGSGLGLAISTRLVEQMDGKIQIESENGSGTDVTIILPTKSG